MSEKNKNFQNFELKALPKIQYEICPEFYIVPEIVEELPPIIIEEPEPEPIIEILPEPVVVEEEIVVPKKMTEYKVAKSGVRYDKVGVFVTYRCNFEVYAKHDPRHELPKVHLYEDCDTKTSDYLTAYEYNGYFTDETGRQEQLRVCRKCLGKYLNKSTPTWKQVEKFNFQNWFAEQNRKFKI